MAMSQHPNIKINSPAGMEAMSYKWPLQNGPSSDNGIEILDTIRWVCEDMPEIKAALEHIQFNQVDTTSYEDMRGVVDIYNKAIDSVLSLVSKKSINMLCGDVMIKINLMFLCKYFFFLYKCFF